MTEKKDGSKDGLDADTATLIKCVLEYKKGPKVHKVKCVDLRRLLYMGYLWEIPEDDDTCCYFLTCFECEDQDMCVRVIDIKGEQHHWGPEQILLKLNQSGALNDFLTIKTDILHKCISAPFGGKCRPLIFGYNYDPVDGKSVTDSKCITFDEYVWQCPDSFTDVQMNIWSMPASWQSKKIKCVIDIHEYARTKGWRDLPKSERKRYSSDPGADGPCVFVEFTDNTRHVMFWQDILKIFKITHHEKNMPAHYRMMSELDEMLAKDKKQ
jgi:hypothetical protein